MALIPPQASCLRSGPSSQRYLVSNFASRRARAGHGNRLHFSAPRCVASSGTHSKRARVFATTVRVKRALLRALASTQSPATPPPPFVFHWPVSRRGRSERPRRTHRFGLTLFGAAVPHAGYVLGALRRGLHEGVGARRNRVHIEAVNAVWPDGTRRERFDGVFTLGDVMAHAPRLGRRVMLRFHTPLSLRKNGRALRQIAFVDIARAAVRRLRLLAPTYPDPARAWARSLLEQAEAVRIVCPRLHWRRLERRSARHSEANRFAGLVGELLVEGELAPFGELLALAACTHIGRHTSFGFGHLSLPRCGPRALAACEQARSSDPNPQTGAPAEHAPLYAPDPEMAE